MPKPIYILSDGRYEGAVSLPVTETVFCCPVIDMGCYDAAVVTSKRAVDALERARIPWKECPMYVIGEGSAAAVRRAGGTVAYIGQGGDAEAFAREIVPLLTGRRILYLRARETASDLGGTLRRAGLLLDECVMYETRCRDGVPDDYPEGSVFIFGAPSAVRCFLSRTVWRAEWMAVAIGTTTAAAFPPEIPCTVAARPDFVECIRTARRLQEGEYPAQ